MAVSDENFDVIHHRRTWIGPTEHVPGLAAVAVTSDCVRRAQKTAHVATPQTLSLGQFYNTFVPGAVGGDVIRACENLLRGAAGTYVVVIAERLVGLGALGVIFAVGYLNQRNSSRSTTPCLGLLAYSPCVCVRPVDRSLDAYRNGGTRFQG